MAEKLLGASGLEVNVYNKKWITDKKMESFLSVAKGSVEQPIFLEMKYTNDDTNKNPIVLIGM